MPTSPPPDRRLIRINGIDALPFLQGLTTNTVLPLATAPGLVWTALLTPQGKYLADFFVVNTGETLLLDLPEALADVTLRRLAMYRLRADVAFASSPLQVCRGEGTPPHGAFADPRHPALGWRSYTDQPCAANDMDWDALRVAHLIPESGVELIPDESYILEHRFEALHGVDFRKGCYVGQEVTARMKHKTALRKGLVQVSITGEAAVGTAIMAGKKTVGQVFTRSGDRALAYLRFDQAGETLRAGSATLRVIA